MGKLGDHEKEKVFMEDAIDDEDDVTVFVVVFL